MMLSLTLLSMMASQLLSKRRRVYSLSSQVCMFHLLLDKMSGVHPQLALPCKKSFYSFSFDDTVPEHAPEPFEVPDSQ